MPSVIAPIEKKLSKTELSSLAKSLHDSYESLMQDFRVWNVIDALAPESIKPILEPMRAEVVGHEIINELVLKYYPCERVVKYHLARRFRKIKNDITVFEMNIDNSRLDLGRINGHSYGYEIKTELDHLTKLPKQLEDYSKVIEYVYVVTPEKHHAKVKDIIPDYCGIMLYKLQGKRFSYNITKEALLSPNINTGAQIRNLASRDLEYILKIIGVKPIPTTRSERENILSKHANSLDFNALFKEAIKNKFRDRWVYLRNNFERIQPIDAQVFFAIPADPYWVYYKNSSIV